MKIKRLFLALIFANLLTVVAPCDVRADQQQATPASVMPEVEELKLIHADSMTLTRQKEKPQVFEGSVDILMLDKAGNETEIKADKITIYYKADLKKVERIEAEGRVKISRLGTVATTELAVYRGDENVIELLVDPHVKDSRGELSANKIVIRLDSDEVIAEGNVRGIVHPGTLEKATSK
jgi:lipopolysaccharide transport protein LptA